jgi:hypothetical protein
LRAARSTIDLRRRLLGLPGFDVESPSGALPPLAFPSFIFSKLESWVEDSSLSKTEIPVDDSTLLKLEDSAEDSVSPRFWLKLEGSNAARFFGVLDPSSVGIRPESPGRWQRFRPIVPIFDESDAELPHELRAAEACEVREMRDEWRADEFAREV